jgi:hypothetical protein
MAWKLCGEIGTRGNWHKVVAVIILLMNMKMTTNNNNNNCTVIPDSLFVDYDTSPMNTSTTTTTSSSTSTTLDQEDTNNYENERDDEDDDSWGEDANTNLGPMSSEDQRNNLSNNPWGTDIIKLKKKRRM